MKEEMNFGEIVACDFCNYGEDSRGGVLIGSYAVCGDCCDRHGYIEIDDKGYPNYTKKAHELHASGEINEIWDTSSTFRANVLRFRKKTHGHSDLIYKIIGV